MEDLVCIKVQVKSMVKVSQTFLDFILLMQVSLGNVESFKPTKSWPIY